MPTITAPWTAPQVAALNAFQQSGRFHPFTCGNNSEHRVLRATERGWVCDDCDYTQAWAHDFMARPVPEWPSQPHESPRLTELWLVIEQLQDALLKVEWVRSHTGTWICAFCGGASEEHGGDGHREGCEYQRLIGISRRDVR